MNIFLVLLGFVLFLHSMPNGKFLFIFGLISFLFSLFGWFRDLIREGTYMGVYTLEVQKNMRHAFVLFIISEIMFFFSFF